MKHRSSLVNFKTIGDRIYTFDRLNFAIFVFGVFIVSLLQCKQYENLNFQNLIEDNLILFGAIPIFFFALFSYYFDPSSMKRSHKHFIFTALMGSYFSIIYTFSLNLVSDFRIYKDNPHIYLSKNQRVWVDRRFDNLSGTYALKKNDLISYQYDGYVFSGQIQGVPGEKTAINMLDHEGRTVASLTEVEIPSEYIAVQSGEKSQIITLIPVKNIKGKIHLSYFELFQKI